MEKWLEKYWKWLAGGVLALLLIWAIISAVNSKRSAPTPNIKTEATQGQGRDAKTAETDTQPPTPTTKPADPELEAKQWIEKNRVKGY